MSGQSSFKSLGIRDRLVHRLKEDGVSIPTPIQEEAIPVLMSGRDLIAQAQTGTGKTLAFALPLLEKFVPEKPRIQGLIVTPTRELAIQITAEMRKLAPIVQASILAVYGGQDVEAQSRKLRGTASIVVCTPGRLLDHLRRGTIDLAHVSMLVLDEADQMLHMGFLPEVEAIIKELNSQRQTMLFSATMPDPIKKLARRYMNQPQDIRIQGKQITLEDIKQFVVETTDRLKQKTLFRMLELYQPYLAVIFCRTKLRAKKLTEAMLDHGFNVDELHGDLTQSKREQVMERFRRAQLQYLVATDVAARGLDIEGVTHVFNYDIPLDPESYIHRIGRTGRAMQKGTAVTLVTAKDRSLLLKIELGINSSLKRRSMEEFGVSIGDEGDASEPAEGSRTSGRRGDFAPRPKGAARGSASSGKPDRRGPRSSDSKPRGGPGSRDSKGRGERSSGDFGGSGRPGGTKGGGERSSGGFGGSGRSGETKGGGERSSGGFGGSGRSGGTKSGGERSSGDFGGSSRSGRPGGTKGRSGEGRSERSFGGRPSDPRRGGPKSGGRSRSR